MARPTITEFGSMITQMISDQRPFACNNCEFFFSMPPPHEDSLGCCIRKSIQVHEKQSPCDWRMLVGIRLITEEAANIVPVWLEAINRWCMGDGSSIEQIAKGFLKKKT